MTHINWKSFYVCEKCGKIINNIKVVEINRTRHECDCGFVWFCGG